MVLELLQGAKAAAGPPTFRTVTRNSAEAGPCSGGACETGNRARGCPAMPRRPWAHILGHSRSPHRCQRCSCGRLSPQQGAVSRDVTPANLLLIHVLQGLMHGDIYLHNTLVVLDGLKDLACAHARPVIGVMFGLYSKRAVAAALSFAGCLCREGLVLERL